MFAPQMSGLFLVLLGAWTLVYKGEYNVLLGSSRFLIIVGLMIGMGGMIMIICMCGCYGSVREHRYLLISVSIPSYLPVPGSQMVERKKITGEGGETGVGARRIGEEGRLPSSPVSPGSLFIAASFFFLSTI